MALVAIAPVMTAWSQQVIFDKMLEARLSLNKNPASEYSVPLQLSREFIPAVAISRVPPGHWQYVYSSLSNEKGILSAELQNVIEDQARNGLLSEYGNLFAVNDSLVKEDKVGYFVFVSRENNADKWFAAQVKFGDNVKPLLGAVIYTRR